MIPPKELTKDRKDGKLEEKNDQLKKWGKEFNALNVVQKNKELRALLKECHRALETYAKEDETCGLEEENKYAKYLLPRINAALGESEEIKILEG